MVLKSQVAYRTCSSKVIGKRRCASGRGCDAGRDEADVISCVEYHFYMFHYYYCY